MRLQSTHEQFLITRGHTTVKTLGIKTLDEVVVKLMRVEVFPIARRWHRHNCVIAQPTHLRKGGGPDGTSNLACTDKSLIQDWKVCGPQCGCLERRHDPKSHDSIHIRLL